MEKKLKEARGSWRLRKGDLPDERTIARAPRLRNARDNAVFRVVLFQQRAGGVRGVLPPMLAILPIFGLFLLMRFFRIGPFGALELLTGLGGVVAIFFLVRHLLGGGGGLAHGVIRWVPNELAADLARTGFPSEEFAIGLWASGSTSRKIRFRAITFWTLSTLFWLGVIFAYLVPTGALPLFLIGALFAVFWQLGLTRWAPYPTLASQASMIAATYDDVRFAVKSSQRDKRLGRSSALPWWAFLAILVGLSAVMGLISNPASYSQSVLSRPGTTLFVALVISVLGFVVGNLRGRHIKLNADSYVERMIEHLDYILRIFVHYQRGA